MMNSTTAPEKELTCYPSILLKLEIDFTAMRVFFIIISSLFLAFAAFILPNIVNSGIKGRC